MVAVGISEFTFGFAFLYEQVHANWAGVQAAPILPSLKQEANDPWDAHLPTEGTDFYFQFKLTDYLSRGNAAFIRDGTYNAPYYRFTFHRRNNNQQHQRLIAHSATHPDTYYVAPEFNNIDNFNAAFLAHQLTNQSRIIPLAACDDVNDGEPHHITFQPADPGWIQHSERKKHEHSIFGSQLPDVYRKTRRKWRPVNKEFAKGLFEKTATVVRTVLRQEHRQHEEIVLPLLDFDPDAADRREVLVRTSEILSVILGVTLVLVGSPE